MSVCTRNGCKKVFSSEENGPESCKYHPGRPVFHEGLKSWSCCSSKNKPVLEFDAFMVIPGCQTGSHTAEATTVDEPKSSGKSGLRMTENIDGKEVYSSTSATPGLSSFKALPRPLSQATPSPAPIVDEDDDLEASVTPGTKCRRRGCGLEFSSDEVNRLGDGEGTVCSYHPAAPIFHEGSKGYLCCKRRVLEFDEFLKIEGCKTGRHCFVRKKNDDKTEVLTTCRIDHYQTPTDVHVTVFAKKADQGRSTVEIHENQVRLDLILPESKRFCRTLNLYGPIDAGLSTFAFFGTKVELILKKQDNRSWNLLEKSDRDLGSFNLTFGVGGRTGTIGGQVAVLDMVNQGKA